jgi:hypothetical protein
VLGLLAWQPGGAASAEKWRSRNDPTDVKTADYVADESAQQSGVVQVSYSTGTSGSKLTWRSRGSADPAEAKAVKQAQFTQPAEEIPAPKPTSILPTANSAFANPFELPGGSKASPPAALNDDQLIRPEAAVAPNQLPAKLPDGQSQISQQPAPAGGSSLEQVLAGGSGVSLGPCLTPKDLPKLTDISVDIRPDATGILPRECTIAGDRFEPRSFACSTFLWRSSCLCHKPLYFEDVSLERYGHTWGPFLQPVLSGAHFFLTVPTLPYKMGLTPPDECIYSLGYYRPGSCAPYYIDPLPLSTRAALFEMGAAVGLAAYLP